MNKKLWALFTVGALLSLPLQAKISKEYFENGKLKFEYNYQNGKKNGITTEYNEDGTIKAKWNFIDDTLNSTTMFKYDKLGNLQNELNYKGEILISIKEYENGKLKGEYNIKNNQRDGKGTVFYPNGKPQYSLNYKNGKLNGIIIEYFQNGNKKAEWNYTDGVLN